MASPIPVYIEMPSYLKKYLIFQSKNKKEPIEFQFGSDYNLLLIRLITNTNRTYPPDKNKPGCKIYLPFNEVKDVYFYNKLSEPSREKFRNHVKNNFLYDFRMLLKHKDHSFFDRKTLVEYYFSTMNITDDDLNYASFYRSFTRYMEKRRVTYCKSSLTQSMSEFVHSKY